MSRRNGDESLLNDDERGHIDLPTRTYIRESIEELREEWLAEIDGRDTAIWASLNPIVEKYNEQESNRGKWSHIAWKIIQIGPLGYVVIELLKHFLGWK